MKIVFVMYDAWYLRNYEGLIELLLKKGHTIHVGITRQHKRANHTLANRLSEQFELFSHSEAPIPETQWTCLSRIIRTTRNYLHYFHPKLYPCHTLRDRARERAPSAITQLAEKLPQATAHKLTKCLSPLLDYLERANPVESPIQSYLSKHKPDLLLITPLVNPSAPEIDYTKQAWQANIPSCLCVASWDNLTSRGSIQGKPDFVILWNETQKQEAIELHNIAENRIYITGAQQFDEWFTQKPTCTYDEFCHETQLDPTQKTITYLCSSPSISNHEVDFIYQWAKTLRASPCPKLSQANILIRPHPESASLHWGAIDKRLASLKPINVWPRQEQPQNPTAAKKTYYNTLHWSHAAVGINTGAFLEAAIAQTPCLTITTEEHKTSQNGTLHFQHLTDGGLLIADNTLKEHTQSLRIILDAPDRQIKQANEFIQTFIRPHGADTSALEHFAHTLSTLLPARFDEIKQKEPLAKTHHKILTTLLSPLFGGTPITPHQTSTIQNPQKTRKKHTKQQEQQLNKDLQKQKNTTRQTAHNHTKFFHIATNQKNVIIGPWLSEIGFELLYWLPFLNAYTSRYNIDPNRCIAISRGGCQDWYQHCATNYEELLTLYSTQEFRKRNEKRIAQERSRKHTDLTEFDCEIIEKVKEKHNLKDPHILHPSLMHRQFRQFWSGHAPIETTLKTLQYHRYNFQHTQVLKKLGIPDDEPYYAVKLYHSGYFRDDQSTQQFICELITRLATRKKVVLLETALTVDDHEESTVQQTPNITTTAPLCTPENNLAIQSAIIAGCHSFYGNYGGFSYLAPLCGKDSISFYSHNEKLVYGHLDIARRTFDGHHLGHFTALPIQSLNKITQHLAPPHP